VACSAGFEEERHKLLVLSRTSTWGSHLAQKGLVVALLVAILFLGSCLIQSMDLDRDSHLSLSSADGSGPPAHPLTDVSWLRDLTAGTVQLFIGRCREGAQITCL
jgi:hypothetical protein